MSGHNKWQQIKHKKGISDQKKGQLFSKLAKKISITARDDPNPSANYKLQAIIEEARGFNMPKENIERAIKRAAERGAAILETIIIQGMGPDSVAIVIEAITDNRNRTISEIKNIFSKNEVKFVPEGSLSWMFDKNWKPNNPIEISDQAIVQRLEKLFDELDAHDDVENIYSNLL